MSSLEQDLRASLTAAMKARDLRTANVIRMINTKVMERRTAANFKGTVDEELVRDVIAAYKKSLEKAREEFASAGDKGASHIAELDFEIGYCQKFLPEQLSRHHRGLQEVAGEGARGVRLRRRQGRQSHRGARLRDRLLPEVPARAALATSSRPTRSRWRRRERSSPPPETRAPVTSRSSTSRSATARSSCPSSSR